MIETLSEIVSDLKTKYDPEFIILYGSFARGDFTEDSDIDIACFCHSAEVSTDIRQFQSRKLDCWIYTLDDAQVAREEFLKLIGGKLLLDKDGSGKSFLSKVQDFYEAGPKPLRQDAREHLIEWSKNMLTRASGNSIEANYRRTWLIFELLQIYFELRNQWYLGSKQSFAWLAEQDPATYKKFENIYKKPKDLHLLSSLLDSVIKDQ